MSILPKEKTPPVADLGRLSILIHGAPKIGKSSLASKFPGVLFAACEPGLSHLEVHQVPITSWEQFLELCAELAKGKHEFRTLAIDTVDLLHKYCVEFILRKNNIAHESDLAYGKGWSLIATEFSRVCLKVLQLGMGVIFISHTTQKEYDTRVGKIVKSVPTLPEKASRVVLSLVDCILYLDLEEYQDEEGNKALRRVIRSKPSRFYDSGDRTGKLPELLPLSYKALASAFQHQPEKNTPKTANGGTAAKGTETQKTKE